MVPMNGNELRQAFLTFYKERGHAIIPSAKIIPENDPTTLFTGSGMQPMVPYLLGQKHPLGTRLTDSQKCFRSKDIEEVGDNRHTTVFEMLGNWSLGDYFKKEQLSWFFEFLTSVVKLDPQRLFVSVFRGDEALGIPRDGESVAIWKELFSSVGIEAIDIDNTETGGMQGGRIFYYPANKNWWSRSDSINTMPIGEPGGPDSEVFFDFGVELKLHENSIWADKPCHPNCDCGRFIEIGNSVFMEYIRTEKGYEKLPQKNVDFGGGLERTLAVANGTPDVFQTDLFTPIITKVEALTGHTYGENEETTRSFRVIADHLRAATMIAVDGVYPSNKDQGYFSRRLLRRAIRYGKKLGLEKPFLHELVPCVVIIYKEAYPEVVEAQEKIIQIFSEEEAKFRKTLDRGLAEFRKILPDIKKAYEKLKDENKGDIVDYENGKRAFYFYETYGFPLEFYREELESEGIPVHQEVLQQQYVDARKAHQDLSRAGAAQKFAGGLADHGEATTKLHTATHLLHEALRRVLGETVKQSGSNITLERLRFDFSYSEKLTDEQVTMVQDIVNEQIEKKLPVTMEMMTVEEAKKKGALALFGEKYGEQVKVYKVGDYSIEVCGGPHVENTGELGHFTITKQENIGKELRRIRAVLE